MRFAFWWSRARGTLCTAGLFCFVVTASAADAPPTFDEHVLPIFREKCCSCHNADKKQGGLDLTSHGQAMAGGSSGEVISPGDVDGSYLWQLASHSSEPKMPPESDRIPSEMLDVIRKWIAGGAIERAGGKPVATKKVSLALDPKMALQPDGPPVMPPRLSLQPLSQGQRPLAITGLAASPNGQVAAVGGRRQVLLYDLASLDLLGTLPFPHGDVKVVRFSRNAKLLLAAGGIGGKSGRVMLWDVATGKPVTELGDEFDQVLAADMSADQRVVAIGGPSKVIRILRTADGSVEADIRKHTDWVTAIEFSPDGRLFASGDRAGNAFLWETRGGREDAVLKGHTGGITAVAWRGDGNVLATASDDGKIRLWNRKDGEKMKEWDGHPGGVQGLCWLADGRLASCGRDRKAVVWKPDGTRERDLEQLADIGLRVTVSSDQKRLLAGDLGGTLVAFETADGKKAGTIDTNPPLLEQRLSTAQAALQEIAAVGKAVADKQKAAADALQAAESQLAAARKAADEAAAELQAFQAREADTTKSIKRWQDELQFSKSQPPATP
jgi:WD40 repeat protein